MKDERSRERAKDGHGVLEAKDLPHKDEGDPRRAGGSSEAADQGGSRTQNNTAKELAMMEQEQTAVEISTLEQEGLAAPEGVETVECSYVAETLGEYDADLAELVAVEDDDAHEAPTGPTCPVLTKADRDVISELRDRGGSIPIDEALEDYDPEALMRLVEAGFAVGETWKNGSGSFAGRMFSLTEAADEDVTGALNRAHADGLGAGFEAAVDEAARVELAVRGRLDSLNGACDYPELVASLPGGFGAEANAAVIRELVSCGHARRVGDRRGFYDLLISGDAGREELRYAARRIGQARREATEHVKAKAKDDFLAPASGDRPNDDKPHDRYAKDKAGERFKAAARKAKAEAGAEDLASLETPAEVARRIVADLQRSSFATWRALAAGRDARVAAAVLERLEERGMVSSCRYRGELAYRPAKQAKLTPGGTIPEGARRRRGYRAWRAKKVRAMVARAAKADRIVRLPLPTPESTPERAEAQAA